MTADVESARYHAAEAMGMESNADRFRFAGWPEPKTVKGEVGKCYCGASYYRVADIGRPCEVQYCRGTVCATSDACQTCDGRGEVGGLLPGDGGYQTDPCPTCSQSDARVKHKVTCNLFPDPFDEREPVGPCTCDGGQHRRTLNDCT